MSVKNGVGRITVVLLLSASATIFVPFDVGTLQNDRWYVVALSCMMITVAFVTLVFGRAIVGIMAMTETIAAKAKPMLFD